MGEHTYPCMQSGYRATRRHRLRDQPDCSRTCRGGGLSSIQKYTNDHCTRGLSTHGGATRLGTYHPHASLPLLLRLSFLLLCSPKASSVANLTLLVQEMSKARRDDQRRGLTKHQYRHGLHHRDMARAPGVSRESGRQRAAICPVAHHHTRDTCILSHRL